MNLTIDRTPPIPAEKTGRPVRRQKLYADLRDNPGVWFTWGAWSKREEGNIASSVGRWFRKHIPNLRIQQRKRMGFIEVRSVKRNA